MSSIIFFVFHFFIYNQFLFSLESENFNTTESVLARNYHSLFINNHEEEREIYLPLQFFEEYEYFYNNFIVVQGNVIFNNPLINNSRFISLNGSPFNNFNIISGIVRLHQGSIYYENERQQAQ
jgi:hypothetical protein